MGGRAATGWHRRHREGLLAATLVLCCVAAPAEAQRPFSTLDTFYQEESARRAFFDGFAAQAEVSYRGADPFADRALAGGPLALSVRLDYALARSLDVAAVFDISGGVNGAALNGAPVRLSWVVVKPYWRSEHSDYAVRIAVDPAADGGFGFRQTDVAFVTTTDVSLHHVTDFTVGIRRSRVGFERLELDADLGRDPVPTGGPEIVRSRAVGTELHAAWGHRLLLDPAGSHAFLSFSAEAMDYDLVTTRLAPPADPEESDAVPMAAALAEGDREGRYRGGVARVRVGVEYTRPSFRVAPYVGVPMARISEVEGVRRVLGPRPTQARLGLRLMLR